MPTGYQIRAARDLLGWSVARLAQESGISERSISRAERFAGVPRMHALTVEALVSALQHAGIEFLMGGDVMGVQLRRR
ncbi:MAG: helix-turn-helix domain-containing protein [Acidobacteria bacterium]|nr:helix-turn-helix domain-containing protein [Acidobacteriota bacterium]